MHIISARNVCEALALGVRLVREEGRLEETRAGLAMVVPVPVVTVLRRPRERVLLDPVRDANPFFHLFEALHMLAGRRDYTWLDRFVRDFSSRFGEADGSGHGAYGWRWRHQFGFDQLDAVVDKLRANSPDRRVVLQMWDANQDAANDLLGDWADVCCNTHVYPRIVDGGLDLTVCCRSNDLIWGLCGANAVHFSMLQEYLAGRIGVGVGTLRTLSNNLHAYVGVLERQAPSNTETDPYDWVQSGLEPVPIGTDWTAWDDDLRAFLTWTDEYQDEAPPDFVNAWFQDVAYPMWMAHAVHRAGGVSSEYGHGAQDVAAPDWRRAATEWLGRRAAR